MAGFTRSLTAIWCPQTVRALSPEEQRKSFWKPENRALKLQNPDTFHSCREVLAGGQIWKLKEAALSGSFAPEYSWQGKTYGINEFNERTMTNALLVLKDGKVVLEAYRNGSTSRTRFISFSIAKSVLSALIGIAIEDGYIKSVEDPLTQYLPGLVGGPYKVVSLEDALQMLSGVDFPEVSDVVDPTIEPDLLFRIRFDAIGKHRYRFVEAANTLRRNRPVGAKFSYNNMDAAVVGWLLETVTKKRLSMYMQERLWQPAGMTANAAWLLDGPPEIGREYVSGGLVATLRDYGRFGQFILNKGRANGKQLVSPDWIAVSTTPNSLPVQFGGLYKESPLGYGYYWWLLPEGGILAEGSFGQFICIEPNANVVIVKLSYWQKDWDEEKEMECYAFFNAVVEALD